MELLGSIKDMAVDYLTGDTVVSFTTTKRPAEVEREFQALKGKQLDIVAKIHREKRSRNANAYFHVLVGKIAEKLHQSKTWVKNDLITSYGQRLYIDEEKASLKTQIEPEAMKETETLHCLLIGCKDEGGRLLYFYDVFRGSHTYNTKEMTDLLEGTIQEAQELGIDTRTPAEVAQMLNDWDMAREWEKNNGPTI